MKDEKKKLELNNPTVYQTNENCQVFTGPISGCVFAMPGATVNQSPVQQVEGSAQRGEETEEDNAAEQVLQNRIFNSRLFDSNDKLLMLRRVIAHSIDMGEYNAMFGEPNSSTINPDVQGEWYYVMKALEESEVTKRFTVPSFVDQMIDWYPWLFTFETPGDMQSFKRKMEKSISHEKSIWKFGKAKEVTRLKDMWARYNQTSIDYAKVERMFNAANTGLCLKLIALKQEIAKEKASR